MSQSFNIPLSGSAEQFLGKAKTAVEKAGGTLNGDEKAGTIAISTPIGGIQARYEIVDTTATIHIDEKPFFLSVDKIRSTLTKYLV